MEILKLLLGWLFDILKERRNGRVALAAVEEGHSRQGDVLRLYVRLVNEGDVPVTVSALQFQSLSMFKRKRNVLSEVKVGERLEVGAVTCKWTPPVALEENTSVPNRIRLVAVYGAGRFCDVMRLKLDDLRATRKGDKGPFGCDVCNDDDMIWRGRRAF